MAGSYNRVTLVGNVVADATLNTTNSGKTVANFTLAVNNSRAKDDVQFVEIAAWNKLGETCATYLKKGQSTLIEGRLQIRSYTDKDGNKRKSTVVVINEMQMLGGKHNGVSAAAEADATDGLVDELAG